MCEKRFFYIHTNIVTKKGGEKLAKQFFQKHTNSARKNVKNNRRKKVRKTFLYIHTNIVNKKWGEITRDTIFPETHEQCEQKMFGIKSSERRAKNLFFIFTIIS